MAETRSAMLNIRVKPELRDRLEEAAKAAGLAPSAYARRVLAEHLSKPRP